MSSTWSQIRTELANFGSTSKDEPVQRRELDLVRYLWGVIALQGFDYCLYVLLAPYWPEPRLIWPLFLLILGGYGLALFLSYTKPAVPPVRGPR